jgi:DNA-binding winged helix-turn-helix (wHTH) protein
MSRYLVSLPWDRSTWTNTSLTRPSEPVACARQQSCGGTLLRRGSDVADADHARIVRFGLFEVDLRAGELRKRGIKIKLQEQPFQVLATLLQHSGDVVTREELRQQLWPKDTFVDFDHGLHAAIKRLRDALGESAERPIFIETLARRGYRFNGSVSLGAAPVAAETRPRTFPAHVPKAIRKHHLFGLVVVALVAALIWFGDHQWRTGASSHVI